MEMECLDNIIGLSETTCPCFDDNKPDDANESESGIFLDQLDGFNLKVIQSGDDCGKGGMWDRMTQAVRNAKVDTRKDLLGCIGQNYKPIHPIFSGQIGEADFKDPLTLSEQYAGVKIYASQLRGAYIYLKRIGIVVDTAVPVTVEVYSTKFGGTLVNSYTTPGPVTANVLTWLSLSTILELPMFSYTSRMDYYVLLKLDGTYKPLDNRRDCGCGGVQRPYLVWVDVQGERGTNVADIRSFNNTGRIYNGIVVDLEVKCKTAELICNSERPLDFDNDMFAQYLAYAIRFKAAVKLYSDVLSTTEINRESMMNRDEITAMRNQWITDYQACINYLCTIIPISTNDCLECRDTVGFKTTGIRI